MGCCEDLLRKLTRKRHSAPASQSQAMEGEGG